MYRLFPPSRHRCIRRCSSPWIMAVLMHYSNIHKSQIQCLHGRTTRYNQRMQRSISECTTRLIWKQMGYSSRILHRVQLLLAKDRKLRLQLKWEQQNWTAKDWKNVAWIYESISTAKFRWIRIWYCNVGDTLWVP